jgi:hypothetical protein
MLCMAYTYAAVVRVFGQRMKLDLRYTCGFAFSNGLLSSSCITSVPQVHKGTTYTKILRIRHQASTTGMKDKTEVTDDQR